ncbi:TrkH family potassium uptake protein [Sedimentibacter hydroxybenzoicus DSM 7310]|uniref:TrkH family potassium uptake protein n=1 Tax=Sedimentibacter hydroxybenzoicus DSM 7310 TaxID=1123245 RepID=A0A974GXL6_SEDHY|nr:TrkH family potassium uptake protein [Sedimentibacter hydroxybenzoicus]NYB75727.1 TrkH family potassium uptake protein [Sedimentibacter hydroxybenzoicus DSM 7310]
MNFNVLLKTTGTVLFWESILMLPSLIIAIYDNSYDINGFLISIIVSGAIGLILKNIKSDVNDMRKREGYATVAICWLVMSIMGALPFYISGSIPSYIDALFETISGFTTTGASILQNIESMPRALLFWRSFTHWIGGMGVLVFTLALIPSIGGRTVFLMRAESSGPAPGKLVPKLSESSKILYIIYAVMTAIIVILLIIAGMPVFDSFIHAFGTAGTGGFSNKALSIGYYNNPYVDWIITIGMFLFGINFTLFFSILRRDWKNILKNEEFRLYCFYSFLGIMLIFLNVLPKFQFNYAEAIRHSAFTVSSLVSTTGYATTDFNLWPMFSKSILMTLMLFGSCAGSTAGGMKSIRVLILFKSILYEIKRTIHPSSVQTIKINNKSINDDTLKSILIFFTSYVMIIIIAIILVSLDNFDFMTTFSSVLAMVSNIGPGFSLVGPMGNFANFSNFSKIVLSACMILGRLELIPILILLSPANWKKH